MQMQTCLLLLAAWSSGDGSSCATETVEPRPSVMADIGRVGGATLAFSLIHADVRRPFFREGSITTVGQNLRHPIRSAVEGGREDTDPFFTNYIAHPVSWGTIGYYMRRRGHSHRTAFLVSQGHSLFWEYVLEGAYQKPSGRDLVTNLVSSYLGILLATEPAAGGGPSVELEPVAVGARGMPYAGRGRDESPPASRGITLRVRLPM